MNKKMQRKENEEMSLHGFTIHYMYKTPTSIRQCFTFQFTHIAKTIN